MQLKYKFYYGGDYNPYEKEADEAYARLTKERESLDSAKERPLEEVFPRLPSWPDYLISNSKSVFWQMERAISRNETEKSEEIEEFWEESKRTGNVGEWLKKAEADEPTKAMCFYMATLHKAFDPIGDSVDFRYYITEGSKPRNKYEGVEFSLEAYE